jgi:hypothetical protein
MAIAMSHRETYRFLNDDEFIETFALAAPGKGIRDLFGGPFLAQK